MEDSEFAPPEKSHFSGGRRDRFRGGILRQKVWNCHLCQRRVLKIRELSVLDFR